MPAAELPDWVGSGLAPENSPAVDARAIVWTAEKLQGGANELLVQTGKNDNRKLNTNESELIREKD